MRRFSRYPYLVPKTPPKKSQKFRKTEKKKKESKGKKKSSFRFFPFPLRVPLLIFTFFLGTRRFSQYPYLVPKTFPKKGQNSVKQKKRTKGKKKKVLFALFCLSSCHVYVRLNFYRSSRANVKTRRATAGHHFSISFCLVQVCCG